VGLHKGDDSSLATVLLLHETMTPLRPIRVVCAIIHDREGRVLLAQRPAHKHLGTKWEFAGGKIEPGELPAIALAREIKEELGCDIEVGQPLPAFTHDYGTVAIEMLPFVCSLANGSSAPHPHEHIAVQWVALSDLDEIDLAPADWPVVAALRRIAKA
jgi:8-oxo-dGTP diphosphatase